MSFAFGDAVTYGHVYRRFVLGRHYNRNIVPRHQRGRYRQLPYHWHHTDPPGTYHPDSRGEDSTRGMERVRYLRQVINPATFYGQAVNSLPTFRNGIYVGTVRRFEGSIGAPGYEDTTMWHPETTLRFAEVVYQDESGRAMFDLVHPDDLHPPH